MADRETRILDALVHLKNEGRITRRQFAKLTGGGVGFAAMSAFLAACGDPPDSSDDDDDSGSGSQSGREATGTPAGETLQAGSGTSEPTEPADEGEVTPGGKLLFALDTAPVGFDPHVGGAFSSQMYYEHVYDSLFQFTPELELIPALAESFDVIDDTTYQFKVRSGVKWQNGREFTAEDVKYSYERMIDPDVGSERAAWFGSIDGIEVEDDTTVMFYLKNPTAPLVSYMGMPGAAIIPREVVEEHGDLKTVAIGTGPFTLDSYETNQSGILKKYADHWRGDVPYLDELEISIATDEASRMAALRAGEVDMTRLFDPQSAEILESEGYGMYKGLSTSRPLTLINCGREPFTDQRVRQALSYAINRQEMLDVTIYGDGELSGIIPVSDTVWSLPATEFDSYTQDLDRARQLLNEAGYGDGFTVTLKVSPQYAFDVSNAQMMQAQLREVGINIEIEQLEWGNLLNVLNETRDYDLLNIIYTYNPDPDGYVYAPFHSASTANDNNVSIPELDELLDRGRATVDQQSRWEVYAEIQKRLMDEWVPVLNTFVYRQYLPAQTYVKGYKSIPSLSRIYLREAWLNR